MVKFQYGEHKTKVHFTVELVRRVTINLSPVLANILTLSGTLSSHLITLT